MPQGNFVNFCYGTVDTPPSPPASGTSFTLTPVGGTTWPAVPFNLTIYPTGTGPLASNAEIIEVTAMTGDTVDASVRGSQGSTPRTIVAGDQAANAITLDDVLAFLSGGGSGTTQSGTEDLNASDTSFAIVFGTAYSGLPALVANIASPDGLDAIIPSVDYSTLTTSGVTVRFPSIPGPGFKLIWMAHE